MDYPAAPVKIYRLVGVRADGTRRLLCGGLPTQERGEHLASELRELSPFKSLVVEVDDGQIEEQPEGD